MANAGMKGYLMRIIAAVVIILVSLKMYPVIQSATDNASKNASGMVASVLPLLPFLFIIALIISIFVLLIYGFGGLGGSGGSESSGRRVIRYRRR